MVRLTELFVSTHSTIASPTVCWATTFDWCWIMSSAWRKDTLDKTCVLCFTIGYRFYYFFYFTNLKFEWMMGFHCFWKCFSLLTPLEKQIPIPPKKAVEFSDLDLEVTCSGHSIIYCNFIHNFWSFEFLNLAVDQLKERRNKLRKRLNNGPHEILQEHLKKIKGRIIWQIFWSSVLFHLIGCLSPTYKLLFCFAVLALKMHPGKWNYFPLKHAVRSALIKIKCHCFSQL